MICYFLNIIFFLCASVQSAVECVGGMEKENQVFTKSDQYKDNYGAIIESKGAAAYADVLAIIRSDDEEIQSVRRKIRHIDNIVFEVERSRVSEDSDRLWSQNRKFLQEYESKLLQKLGLRQFVSRKLSFFRVFKARD